MSTVSTLHPLRRPRFRDPNILFRWHAGGRRPDGLQFSRNSPAWRTDIDGVVKRAAADVPRIEWLDLDGDGQRETPAVRKEGQRTNLVPSPATLAGHTISTVGTGVTDLGSGIEDGVATVHFERTDQSGGDRRYVTPAFAVDVAETHVFTIEWRDNSGGVDQQVIEFYLRGSAVDAYANGQVGIAVRDAVSGLWAGRNGCTVLEDVSLEDGWHRVRVQVPPSLWDGSGGGAIIQMFHRFTDLGVWNYSYRRPQVERALFGTSFTEGTREADLLVADLTPILTGRGAFAIYLRTIERGTIVQRGWARLLSLQAGSQAIYLWAPDTGKNTYETWLVGWGTNYGAKLDAGTPQMGQEVEHIVNIDGGNLTLQQSIAGGPIESKANTGDFTGFTGAPVQMAVGSTTGGGSNGTLDIRDVVLLRGSGWTFDDLRTLLP